eukprot:scaffold4466_cov130-Amphora_coffeaeformis.AAC.1
MPPGDRLGHRVKERALYFLCMKRRNGAVCSDKRVGVFWKTKNCSASAHTDVVLQKALHLHYHEERL